MNLFILFGALGWAFFACMVLFDNEWLGAISLGCFVAALVAVLQ